MINPQIFIVIPTIRDLNFLKFWKNQFQKCNAVIIEDHPNKIIKSPTKYFKRIYHYTWENIDKDLGINNWIFSRKNAGIRSYGFYKAYKLGADVIITIDDDCFPADDNFVWEHIENLQYKFASDWFPTYPDPKFIYTRGFPYQIRNKLKVAISHGLWSGALDLDAKTEINLPKLLTEKPYPPLRQIIPFGYFFPMCSMNLAFRREITPLMYFPLMGYAPDNKQWGYDRYDDIWCGLFTKKICDYLRISVINGSPFVEHHKKSIIASNVIKEMPGLSVNEYLWKKVAQVNLTSDNIVDCYKELINQIQFPNQKYFIKLKQAMKIWIDLFEATP
jgi:reversibly glycosylated polypeptide / UDP-arabinopyranose mutase